MIFPKFNDLNDPNHRVSTLANYGWVHSMPSSDPVRKTNSYHVLLMCTLFQTLLDHYDLSLRTLLALY